MSEKHAKHFDGLSGERGAKLQHPSLPLEFLPDYGQKRVTYCRTSIVKPSASRFQSPKFEGSLTPCYEAISILSILSSLSSLIVLWFRSSER